MLSVQANFSETFSADGLERTQANMKGDGLDLDAVLLELCEDFGGEVEAGSGRRGASDFMGEDGLVAVAIFGIVVAMDVRGERHVPDFVEDSVEVWRGDEAQGAFAEVGGGENFGFQHGLAFVGGVEEEAFSGLDLAAGTDEGGPFVGGKLLGEKDFDAA